MFLFGDIVNIGEDENFYYILYVNSGAYVLSKSSKEGKYPFFRSANFRHLRNILEIADLYVTPNSPLYSFYLGEDCKIVEEDIPKCIKQELSILVSDRASQVSADMVKTTKGTLTSFSSPVRFIYDSVSVKDSYYTDEEWWCAPLQYVKGSNSIWDNAYGIINASQGEVVVIPSVESAKVTKGGKDCKVCPDCASPYYCTVERINPKGFLVYV